MKLPFRQTSDMSKEKIALLSELHRPLEEHWSVKSKFGLDAKGSDYIYKHHITRLEDIYVNHKFEVSEVPIMVNMSPVSQLYGVHGDDFYRSLNVMSSTGLKTNQPGWEDRQRRKEEKWIDNFQVDHPSPPSRYAHDHTKNSRFRSRSSSPSRHSVRGNTERALPRSRSQCTDAALSQEDLIMLGMYKLDERQKEIYDNFVQMLTEFDNFDKVKIVEDALLDSNNEDLLQGYGGTQVTAEYKIHDSS